MKVAIYLSGSIQKGENDSKKKCWTEEDEEKIKSLLPDHEVFFLNPKERGDDLTDDFSTFGRDLFQTTSANFVLVDARERRGIGIGAEMVIAKTKKIPVISLVERNSYYKRDKITYLGQECDDWTHPFIAGLSDFVAESLENAAQWIDEHLHSPKRIKGPDIIDSAISYYKTSQLPKDKPMKDILKALKND